MTSKPKVLYLAAGNPVAPCSGMDVTSRAHICELASFDAIDLTGIFVAPGVSGSSENFASVPWPNFTGFFGDLQNQSSLWMRALRKIGHVLRGGLLFHYAFLSTVAQRAIERELAKKYDLVVVDHVLASANIDLRLIEASGAPLVFIAHDATHHAILDAGRLKKSLFVKLYYRMQALQVWRLDMRAMRQAVATVFLSQWDMQHYTQIGSRKTSALCPVLAAVPAAASLVKPYEKTLVFIGSTGFAPNKFALDWIVEKLAPRLVALDPAITIALVGKGTQHMKITHASNIKAMGFVSGGELAALLRDCLCMICPVIHGSGIKIKILEALAAGTPVFATEESLRGFEFMKIAPQIDIGNPRAAAEKIAALANDLVRQLAERTHVNKGWAEHVAKRQGGLNRLVGEILGLPC